MKLQELVITPELPCHHEAVEALGATAFGPGRFARTAFRLREGRRHEDDLSFVALENSLLVGSVRITRIVIGDRPALVLGPLVVDPGCKNRGIGTQLMEKSVNVCKKLGQELIILVGDEPYYRPFGFKMVPSGQIILPGPVDPSRFLCCELKTDALGLFRGVARVDS